MLATFAALTTLPYMALKIAWLSGHRIGLSDPEFGRSTAMHILNSLTLALDVVALVLAVIFLTRRGLRAPAWIVLPPMWIGAGLLGQILVSTPISLVVTAVAPSHPPTDQLPPIESWVYAAVYCGFTGLGVGLLGAFALYARQRWGSRPVPQLVDVAGHGRVVARTLVAAGGLAVAAGVAGVLLSAAPRDARLLDLAVACATAAALVGLAHPDLRARTTRTLVVLAFIGTGALAAWGTYLFVISVLPNELVAQTVIDWRTAGVGAARAATGFVAVGALALRLRPRC